MKKIIIAFAVFIVGCGEGRPKGDIRPESKMSNASYKVDIKTIDSCEYLIAWGWNGRCIIHKHNCKYCLERNKQVIHDTLIYDPVMVKKFRPALPSELETIKNQNK